MTFRIEVFKGKETAPYAQTLAELRTESFLEFPYLYICNRENELRYAQLYASTPQGMFVIAFQDEEIVGLFSGLPLATSGAFLEGWSKVLTKESITVENYFYAGELIVKPAYRKQGLGTALTKRFLQEVDALGLSGTMLVTAMRAIDHPLRPQGYFDTDAIWDQFGFEKTPIVFTGIWPTRQSDGTVKTEENQLACWLKKEC